jgi:hypothetical protein
VARLTTRPRSLRAASLAVTAVALLVAAPPALANRGDDIIRECLAKDKIAGAYTQQEYAYALAHLPADVDEYSDCRAVITRAKLAAAAGGPAPGAGVAGGNPLDSATPAERRAVAQGTHEGRRPVRIAPGQKPVLPGGLPVRTDSTINALPISLAIALAALAVVALVGAVGPLRRLVRSRRQR